MRILTVFTIALTLAIGVFVTKRTSIKRAMSQEMDVAGSFSQYSVSLEEVLRRFCVPHTEWIEPDLSDLPPLYQQMALRILAVPAEERPPLAVCVAPGTPIEVVEKLEAILYGGHLDYQLYNRWTSTAHGSTGGQGDPIVLTYSYVPDGVWVPGGVGEPGSANVLFATLDAKFGSTALWQSKIAQVFARWSELTGITYVQENDDGAPLFGSPGVLGVRGDMRFCAHNIDGASNILAYCYYPNGGDICLDTSESWGSSGNDYRFFRNAIAHELGHGIGLAHVCPANGTKLMEPYLNIGFDGPQHDDQRGAQRYYGDRYEDNDSAASATNLGTIEGVYVVSDVCTDDNNESDYYAFTVASGQNISLMLIPIGWSYQSGPETGDCSTGTTINSLAINNLDLYLYDTDGTTLLASSASHPAGETESIDYFLPSAGTYYARVTSDSANDVQTYKLALGAPMLCGSLRDTLGPGTYHAICDISVDAGDSLRLAPGTIFVFDGYYAFAINGTLLAEGTETNSIVFTADTGANPDRWHGLRFYDSTSSNSQLTYCRIENGLATGSLLDMFGGGVCCQNSSPTFANCSFSSNSAAQYGGGVYCKTSSSNFTNCVFSNNSATVRGGGAYCDYNPAPAFINCVFRNNSSNYDGGGAFCNYSSASFTHCTFSNNSASNHGGGVIFSNSSAIFNSSIVAFCSGEGMHFASSIGCAVKYCDFYGNGGGNIGNPTQGPRGIGALVTVNANGDSCDTHKNILLDPMFEDRVASDYHLLEASHCIGAGDPSNPPPTDMDGNPRPNPPGSISDIGAYENWLAGPIGRVVISIENGNAVLSWPPFGSTYNYNIYGSSNPYTLGTLLHTESNTTWMDTETSSRPSPYFYYVTAAQ